MQIAQSVSLSESGGKCVLVTASGSIISDSKVSTAGDTRPWTLGYYL